MSGIICAVKSPAVFIDKYKCLFCVSVFATIGVVPSLLKVAVIALKSIFLGVETLIIFPFTSYILFFRIVNIFGNALVTEKRPLM